MRKTASSLLSVIATLGLIAASVGVVFVSETPTSDQSANSVPVLSVAPSADPVPGNGANNNDAPQLDPQPSGMSQPPNTPDPELSQDPQPSQPGPLTPAADQAPIADQGGAGAASGPVGTTGVATRGQTSTDNDPAPASTRGDIRNMDAPAGTPTALNSALTNTGSVASIAADAGVIAPADGVILVAARKRH